MKNYSDNRQTCYVKSFCKAPAAATAAAAAATVAAGADIDPQKHSIQTEMTSDSAFFTAALNGFQERLRFPGKGGDHSVPEKKNFLWCGCKRQVGAQTSKPTFESVIEMKNLFK